MFIDQETLKRVNIHAPYKGRSKLDTPEIRAELGVVEIPDPVRGNDDLEYTQELDDAPYIAITPKSPEQLAIQNQTRTNQTSLAYLLDTDWMVTRFAETGVVIPDAVKVLRQAARDAIVRLP